jgi:hypothetical protein
MENGFERRTTQARNVLGLLKGSDPLLQNELIIVGAHYDHVGTDPDGTIYNGANDNASGVAVMLEIARLWQAQGYWPARSVLFAAWDAEEQGLYGSQHYVDNPIPGYPLDQTLAYFNLDMAGLGEQVYIYGDGIVGNQLERSADALGIRVEGNYQQFPGDALPFHNTGIPTGFITLEAASGNYVDVYLHRPEDDPQKIQTDNLELIGRVATHALLSWSMAPQSTALPVTVKLTQGGEVRLPAGTPILLTLGWAATSDENVRDFLDAIHMSITLDGVQVDLANNYWGAVLAGNGGNSTSHWLYPLGVLDPGVHTIQVTGTLIQPVSDGYGTYSGVIWNLISMQIEVY